MTNQYHKLHPKKTHPKLPASRALTHPHTYSLLLATAAEARRSEMKPGTVGPGPSRNLRETVTVVATVTAAASEAGAVSETPSSTHSSDITGRSNDTK